MLARRRRGALALALLLAGPAARAGPASVGAGPAALLVTQRPEAELLLLAVKLDAVLLTEALPAYPGRGDVLVPLGALCEILSVGIDVDAARGTASGFFVREDRRFDLDVVSRQVTVDGVRKRFDATAVELHGDDVFVGAALLSEWLPLGLDVDLYASLLTVRPGEKLPVQLRLERERKLRNAGPPRGTTEALPRLDLPYRLFEAPFVDQSLGFSRQASSGGGSGESLTYTTNAAGDLLGAEATAFLSGSGAGLGDVRLGLGRKDPYGKLLGFLRATEAAVGDVYLPALDLVTASQSGTGFVLGNYPLGAPTQFDRQTFRDALPVGWDVELYQNNVLVALAPSRPDGLYEFADVPLYAGMNVFRLEFYGPQGQRRTETRTLNVGQSLTPKGKLFYRLAGADPTLRLAGAAPPGAGERATLEASFGVAKNLSASAALSEVSFAGLRHAYARLGLRGYAGRLFANVDAAVDKAGGWAWQGTAQTRLAGVGFFVQQAWLADFVSEAFRDASGRLRSRTLLRLDSAIPATFLPRIPVYVDLRQDRYEDGRRESFLTARLSAFSRGLSVTNYLRWSFSSGRDTSTSTANGLFFASKLIGTFSARGEVEYDLSPQTRISSAKLVAEAGTRTGYVYSAQVGRLFAGSQTQLAAGVSRLEGLFSWAVSLRFSSPGGFGASALVSVGIGREPRTGRWMPQARPMASSGAISARTFLDANGNGVADPGEDPLAGAGLRLNGAGSLARSDASGILFLPNVGAYQPTDVEIATDTLEDPLAKPGREGVHIVPRPGKVAVIDFPVVVSGEITGTVYLLRGTTRREASAVELELVDEGGKVRQTVRSAFDGFYDLTEVRPGRYTLRVSGRHVEKLALLSAPSRQVEILPGGTVLDGVDLVLEGPASPAPPAALPSSGSQAAPEGRSFALLARPAASPAPVDPGSGKVAELRTREWAGKKPVFVVHLSSYRTREKADADAARLAARLGTAGRSVEVDLGAAGTWYRVVLGDFASAASARRFAAEIAPKVREGTGRVYLLASPG